MEKTKIVVINGTFYREANGNLFKIPNAKSCKVIVSNGKSKDGENITFVSEVLQENVSGIEVRGKDGNWRAVEPKNFRTVRGCQVRKSNGDVGFVSGGKPQNGIKYTNAKTGKTVYATV